MASYGNSSRDPGPVPDRWLNCPRKSLSVIESIFLAFKTPLSKRFEDKVPPHNRFTPQMLFDNMKSMKLKLGLWIDLTNTSRFYDQRDIEEAGCKYVKINCKGHGETPSPENINAFIKICEAFRRNNPLSIIGVHCTHGFNRTGFVIAHYLVRVLDWDPAKAIRTFAEFRPPGIYKHHYLKEFFEHYDEDLLVRVPELPSWHTESDDSEGGNSNGAPSGGGRRGGKVPVFMAGVQGVTPVLDKGFMQEIQRKIQQMCKFRKLDFPGCQPVSMSRENITMLRDNPYHVSWKADGTRYMMLIDGKEKIFFADRNNSIFHAPNVAFKDKLDLKVSLKETLVDGEMVIDVDPQTKQHTPRFLIYDAIIVRGKDVSQDPFSQRFERIFHDIIRPRNEAIRMGIIDRRQEPFSVRRKEFWEANITNTSKLLSDNFKKQLSHEPDGLIFQPSSDPYVTGQCDRVLKWKPASHNSVDFKAKIEVLRSPGMLPQVVCKLFVGGLDVPFGQIIINKKNSYLKEMDGKIIECNFDDKQQFSFMRERTDKSFPNSYATAKSVMETIREPVDENFLLEFMVHNPYRKSDRELMPPPHRGLDHHDGPMNKRIRI